MGSLGRPPINVCCPNYAFNSGNLDSDFYSNGCPLVIFSQLHDYKETSIKDSDKTIEYNVSAGGFDWQVPPDWPQVPEECDKVESYYDYKSAKYFGLEIQNTRPGEKFHITIPIYCYPIVLEHSVRVDVNDKKTCYFSMNEQRDNAVYWQQIEIELAVKQANMTSCWQGYGGRAIFNIDLNNNVGVAPQYKLPSGQKGFGYTTHGISHYWERSCS